MSFAPGSGIIFDLWFYVYLCWAAWQDHKHKLVLRGTHLLGFGAVLLRDLMNWHRSPGSGQILVLLVCLTCEGLYHRLQFYGLADSLVFVNCFLYDWGWTDAFSCFFGFWWMKACSGFLFLLFHGICRRRLIRRLEEPAAYIPWILGAFALTNAVLRGYNV
ncbi:MAG: hypothetical protein LUH19_01760 [Lachnospiraceae bacterium]|nr:hypothetical protein [Lachnospiraceae bacterium]